MKEGKGVESMASGKEGVASDGKEGEASDGKEGEASDGKKGVASDGKEDETITQKTTQPVNTGKETKRQPPVDANGKPVSVDHHWKEFMKKSGKSQKRKNEVKEEKKEKKAKTFFDDDSETVGTKKVPLRSKSSVCWER